MDPHSAGDFKKANVPCSCVLLDPLNHDPCDRKSLMSPTSSSESLEFAVMTVLTPLSKSDVTSCTCMSLTS